MVCFWSCLSIGYAEARKCVFCDDCATRGKSPEVSKQWHCKIEDNIFNQPLSKDKHIKQFKEMMNRQIYFAIITPFAVGLLTKLVPRRSETFKSVCNGLVHLEGQENMIMSYC